MSEGKVTEFRRPNNAFSVLRATARFLAEHGWAHPRYETMYGPFTLFTTLRIELRSTAAKEELRVSEAEKLQIKTLTLVLRQAGVTVTHDWSISALLRALEDFDKNFTLTHETVISILWNAASKALELGEDLEGRLTHEL